MSTPDFQKYLEAKYPKESMNASNIQTGARFAYDQNPLPVIRPNEAQRVAEATVQPTSALPEDQANMLLGAEGLTGGGTSDSAVRQVAQYKPTAGHVAMAPRTAGIAPAAALSAGMAATPNYVVPRADYMMGNVPVAYGEATGGQAPAGTVTPAGHTVAANSAPAAGTLGGGGKPPIPWAQMAGTLISGLGSAAQTYIGASAIPQPTMEVVTPSLAQFPLNPIGQHAAVRG